MSVKRVQKFAPVLAVIAVFAALLTFNVQALTAEQTIAAGEEYGMVHVANNVWHCTSGGAGGCDNPSSHVWGPPGLEPEEPQQK